MNRNRVACGLAAMLALAASGAEAALCDAPGSWMVRVGGSDISPTKTSTISLVGTPVNVDVSDKVGLSFNVDYFFCRNFAVDVVGALPFTHDIALNGTKTATTQHLPPTVTLQYHPLADSQFDPFVGVGVNYTMFFNTSLNGVPAGYTLDLKNTFGYALQGGVDYKYDKHWRAGFDLRYIGIEPKAYLNAPGLGKYEMGTAKIDPIVYSINVGYMF